MTGGSPLTSIIVVVQFANCATLLDHGASMSRRARAERSPARVKLRHFPTAAVLAIRLGVLRWYGGDVTRLLTARSQDPRCRASDLRAAREKRYGTPCPIKVGRHPREAVRAHAS